ncbi:hypothetical protein BV133_2146 [Blastochloris viridis]|uniref:Uncharacterized protein n=1 Tax=Blastochloris viridis TaxID=1079 RepID=A0A182D2R5_BLAVI|nr:hypothetical protein BV133_2146 [Blastochloris viridis]
MSGGCRSRQNRRNYLPTLGFGIGLPAAGCRIARMLEFAHQRAISA